jgi:ketosteroid isomerase-like protein
VVIHGVNTDRKAVCPKPRSVTIVAAKEHTTMTDQETQVSHREAARRDALIALDREALAALLADDLIWTHANGATDTRDSYLGKLGGVRFEEIATLGESVLVLGTAATVKSEYAMRLRTPADEVLDIRSTASSVWSLADGTWLLRRFHSGNLQA